MNTPYEKFEVSDFLKDKSFLLWKFFPDDDSEIFWNNFQKRYPHQKNNLERAIQILDTVHFENIHLSQTDREDLLVIYKNTQKLYVKRKQRRRLYYSLTAAASIALFVLFSLFYYHSNYNKEEEKTVSEKTVQDTTRQIQLILGHRDKMLLTQNVEIQLDKKRKIEITNKKEKQSPISKTIEKEQYNRLIVPKGKHSSLTLPDGTKIWVNSGSSISFPSEFNQKEREISLADGEIYLEVAKDRERPFFVNTSFGKVIVHGTKFDITAYQTDKNQYVVLAEGSISVRMNTSQKVTLKPNQKLDISDGTSKINQVNPYEYICWKDGIMKFSNETMENLLRRLSRHYGVDFKCDEILQQKSCTGKMVLFEDLDEVLNTLTDIFPIQCIKENDEIKILVKH